MQVAHGRLLQQEACSFSQACVAWLQLLTDVHQPLLELVVAEAFEAAINVAGQENLDVRLHEMRYAMPPSNKVLPLMQMPRWQSETV